jgi:G:T-mismatch repair DNA endonuclease (very short patch repair protein)
VFEVWECQTRNTEHLEGTIRKLLRVNRKG